MNLSTKNLFAAVTLASGLVAGQQAFANTIDGTIDFNGTAYLNGSLSTATAINSFAGVTVATGTQTGSYTGTDGVSVTMNGFTFSPSLSPNPVEIYSFTSGGSTYSFSLSAPVSVATVSIGGFTFLNLGGSGVASLSGYEDTAGTWSLSISATTGAATLAFSSTSTASGTGVPDGGSSALMLGGALVGIAAVRRSISK